MSMPRRTRSPSPQKRRDEQRFPVRIRIEVPEEGFGRQLDEMHQWLTDNAGRDGFAWHADTLPGLDASAVFLRDERLVGTFVQQFDLKLVGVEFNSV